MYFEGIGTTQNFNKSLKYSWLCALNGNDKCIKKIKKIKDKLSEDEVIAISKDIPKRLEDNFLIRNDLISAFKLGYWFENFSPEIDFEKSYLWYSVSVSAGMYKAMKLRDRVAELIDKKKLNELQIEANEIFTKKINILEKKGMKMIYKVHWIVDGVAEIEADSKEEAEKKLQESLEDYVKNSKPLMDKFYAKSIQGTAYLPGRRRRK